MRSLAFLIRAAGSILSLRGRGGHDTSRVFIFSFKEKGNFLTVKGNLLVCGKIFWEHVPPVPPVMAMFLIASSNLLDKNYKCFPVFV